MRNVAVVFLLLGDDVQGCVASQLFCRCMCLKFSVEPFQQLLEL